MKLVSCLLLAVASLTTSLQAANISYGGFIEGTAVQDWRTSTTSKGLFDIDGNNVFGSLGALHWTQPPTGQNGAGVLGWTLGPTVGNSGQVASPGAPLIDLLGSPGQKSMAGIGAIDNAGSFQFTLNGTAADYLGKTVRVSVMADVLEASLWAVDATKTYRMTGPGGADSGTISLRGGASGNGVPEMYFFDITNVTAGDTFTFLSPGSPSLVGYAGPVALDIAATVPEPGTAIFGILGLGTLLARRRRSRV